MWYIHPQVITWFNEFKKDNNALFNEYEITPANMAGFIQNHFRHLNLDMWYEHTDELLWLFFFSSMYIPYEYGVDKAYKKEGAENYNQAITNKLVVAGDYGIQYGFNEEMLDEVLRIYRSNFQKPLADGMRHGWEWQESSFIESDEIPKYHLENFISLGTYFINWPNENPLGGKE